jgi:hypothetical protein
MFESAARNDDFCMSTFFRSCFEARSQIDFITDYRQIFAPTAADIAEQNCSPVLIPTPMSMPDLPTNLLFFASSPTN